MVEIESKPKLEKVEIIVERASGEMEIHTIDNTKITKETS